MSRHRHHCALHDIVKHHDFLAQITGKWSDWRLLAANCNGENLGSLQVLLFVCRLVCLVASFLTCLFVCSFLWFNLVCLCFGTEESPCQPTAFLASYESGCSCLPTVLGSYGFESWSFHTRLLSAQGLSASSEISRSRKSRKKWFNLVCFAFSGFCTF